MNEIKMGGCIMHEFKHSILWDVITTIVLVAFIVLVSLVAKLLGWY